MLATRRQFLAAVASASAAVAAGCAPTPTPQGGPACTGPGVPPGPLATPGSVGLVDEAVHLARAAEYLEFATQSLSPGSATNVVAHLVRAAQDPTFTWDPAAVTEDAFAGVWSMLEGWEDTGDFQIMYLHWLLRLGQGVIDPSVLTRIEDELLAFRYRYDDPLPAGRIDHKWFWSENHRVIFLVDEYLAGTWLPDRTFAVTGLTGAEHAARARPELLAWVREKGRFGFSEWHSNVYLLKDITPLLTLVELADDEELIRAGTIGLDLCLVDLATHLQAGAYGATRGRTYKKDKMSARDEATFGTAKLLFDDTSLPYTNTADTGATYLCAASRYRVPEVVRRIATSSEVALVRERHGVPLDPHEPLSPDPQAPYGYDYDDPANLPFWWSQGALTSWQLVPGTLAAANRWRLWETDLFQRFGALQSLASIPPAVAQAGARELASMTAAGVLGEAHTMTWRAPEVMLSTVQDHRFGDAMEQVHAWQATLDADALVFTTHPRKRTPTTLDWTDDPGYWTGTSSMPRSAQWGRAAIHIYRPAYDSPTDPLLGPGFGYLPETHAYFPRERFDEWVQVGGWTCARKGDGYVGLWSERPTVWRTYDPAVVATHGLLDAFDLVAEGSAANVWVVEVGRAADDGSFAQFVDALVAGTPTVGDRQRVRYASPGAGVLEWGRTGPLVVDGVSHEVRDHPRHESPWATTCHQGGFLDLTDGPRRLVLDTTTGARVVS